MGESTYARGELTIPRRTPSHAASARRRQGRPRRLLHAQTPAER